MTVNTLRLLAVVAILLVFFICIAALMYFVDQWIQKSNFCKKYGLVSLPKGIRIRQERDNGCNEYELKYPYWHIQKNDGTADKRYSGNYIIWPESHLWVSHYKLSAKKPTVILDVVQALRDAGIKVEMNEEERKKKKRLEKQKQLFACDATIQNIVDGYKDCPTEFEQMCAELFRKQGYQCKVTPKTNDGGYDISMQKEDTTAIAECKCYSVRHKVGRPEIQKLVGANVIQQAQKMFFITTSSFTPEARAYAKETEVTLVSGQQLLSMLQKYGFPKQEIKVKRTEWQLSIRDLKKFIPADIYWDYFA